MRNMRCFELFGGKHIRFLSAMDLRHRMAGKWRFSGKCEPERLAQRVDVRAHVERRMFKLFRAGECRCTHESALCQRLPIRCRVKSFGQTEIDYFHHRNPALAERPYSTSLKPGLIASLHFGVVRIYEHQV